MPKYKYPKKYDQENLLQNSLMKKWWYGSNLLMGNLEVWQRVGLRLRSSGFHPFSNSNISNATHIVWRGDITERGSSYVLLLGPLKKLSLIWDKIHCSKGLRVQWFDKSDSQLNERPQIASKGLKENLSGLYNVHLILKCKAFLHLMWRFLQKVLLRFSFKYFSIPELYFST